MARGFRVVGRVQGVGFRWWTRSIAQGMGLRGMVRNLADGSVEVQAVGPEAGLARLEAALGQGPGAARVDRVDRVAADGKAPRSGFVIDSSA